MKMENQHKSLIFAHRGANREAPENTRSAFDRALNYPLDGIETDVQLTKDWVPVLWHDETLAKLGFPDKRIADYNFAELMQFDCSTFYPGQDTPEPIMDLASFITRYHDRCRLQIEIKNFAFEPDSWHRTKIDTCLEFIGDIQDGRIFISSFDLPSLIYAHNTPVTVTLYYAILECPSLSWLTRLLTQQSFLRGLCLPINVLTTGIMQILRVQGKSVITYTCNSREDIARSLELGVDIIITDNPALALQTRVESG